MTSVKKRRGKRANRSHNGWELNFLFFLGGGSRFDMAVKIQSDCMHIAHAVVHK